MQPSEAAFPRRASITLGSVACICKRIWLTKAMGLHVCAVDIDDGKLAHAKCLGADVVVNANSEGAVESGQKATNGGAHGVLITAPSLVAFKQGVSMTRTWGTCVLLGLPPGEFHTPLFDVVAKCITIHGSFVGNRRDMAEALSFAVNGKVKADIAGWHRRSTAAPLCAPPGR